MTAEWLAPRPGRKLQLSSRDTCHRIIHDLGAYLASSFFPDMGFKLDATVSEAADWRSS